MTLTLTLTAALLPSSLVIDLVLASWLPSRRPAAPRVIRINPRAAELARRYPPHPARKAA